MKKTVAGIVTGILISAGLLVVLALWPLPNETQPSLPDLPPVIPPAPMVSESPDPTPPQPVQPVEKPADVGMTEPALPNKTVVKPSRETKRAEAPRKTKPAAPSAGNKTRTETAKQPAAAPVQPPSPLIGPSDLDAINSLLNRLKSAYTGEDLTTIKELLSLSMDQEVSLKKIFNSYKGVQVDLEEARITGNQVTSAIVIASVENEKGNAVIPGPSWRRQPLTVTSKNNLWNQIALAGSLFSGPQKGPADLIAPTITHALPAYTAKPGEPAEISAMITDTVKIAQASLHFRAQGDRNYETTRMSGGPDNAYSGRIPGSMIKAGSTSMEYYIEAKDTEGNVSTEGRPTAPLVIAVVPAAAE
ncbi:MAG TPA: hypothetical protein VIL61_03455 [Nitrospiria bacterium]